MQLVFAIIAFIIIRLFNTLSIKNAQEKMVSSFKQTLVFTALFSAFQAICLLVLPPYNLQAVDRYFVLMAACYSVFFVLAYVFFLMALDNGPTAVTNAVFSFSTIVTIAAGLIFWKEQLGVYKICGLILFVLALFLFNNSSYSANGEKKKITKKWFILILLATISSGICVIFTKYAMIFNSCARKEYLLIYNICVVLICLPLLLRNIKPAVSMIKNKKFVINTFVAAVTQNFGNYLFMFYIVMFDTTLFMPATSVLNMMVALIVGRLFIKEKMSVSAYVSMAISIISVFLLSI